MTTEKTRSFRASDAFHYVDTYRSLILNEAGYIEAEKKRIEEKMWGMGMVPARLYAELRAHEHALDKKVEGTDPGVVVLGPDEEGEGDEGKGPPRPTREELQEKEREIESLRGKLRVAEAREQDLQTELVKRRQDIGRLKRKLDQTYSSIYVVSITLGLVIVVLLMVRFMG